jgi:prevent-host-death family protein
MPPRVIDYRQLRYRNAEIIQLVEAGVSLVITSNGTPIADLIPRAREPKRRTVGELQEDMRKLPPIDVEQWYRDREADDLIFGDDRIEC